MICTSKQENVEDLTRLVGAMMEEDGTADDLVRIFFTSTEYGFDAPRARRSGKQFGVSYIPRGLAPPIYILLRTKSSTSTTCARRWPSTVTHNLTLTAQS
jgi:hypothetical protein